MTQNRHPVDRLAEVRQQIKALQETESLLKDEVSSLMGDENILEGDDYVATQAVSTRKGGLDDKALRRDGIDPDKYRKADVLVYSVRVVERGCCGK